MSLKVHVTLVGLNGHPVKYSGRKVFASCLYLFIIGKHSQFSSRNYNSYSKSSHFSQDFKVF